MGRVEQTLIGIEPVASSSRPEIEFVFGGVAGDRHCGHTKPAGSRERDHPAGTPILNLRQVSVVSLEECAEVAGQLGVTEVPAEDLGANLCLSGIERLSALPPLASIWFDSGAVLLNIGANAPCKFPGRLLAERYPGEQALPAHWVVAARGRRGIVGMVQRPGIIRPGDSFEVREKS